MNNFLKKMGNLKILLACIEMQQESILSNITKSRIHR